MKNSKSWPQKLWRVVSGFEIAIICMILLLLIVFFSTLEQAEEGLYVVTKRYYDLEAYFVQPKLNGKLVPLILPGAYWVCCVFTLNLLLGGVLRLTKLVYNEMSFEKRIARGLGVLISHGSIAFLMISGAVTYHLKESSLLLVPEGGISGVATIPDNVVIEVRDVTDNQDSPSHVVDNKHLEDLIVYAEGEVQPLFWKKADKRQFRFPDMPFTLEVEGWYRNVRVLDATRNMREESDGAEVNKIFLRNTRAYTDTEMMQDNVANLAGAYLKVIPDDKSIVAQDLVVWQQLNDPVSVTIGERVYGFKMDTKKILLPFEIKLDRLVIDKYEGSERQKAFQSYVTYMKDDDDGGPVEKIKFFIEMNEPMRHKGYTLFQTSVGTNSQTNESYSVFEVVKNPSDQWPKYSIYVCGIALLVHFLYKLIMFVNQSMKKNHG